MALVVLFSAALQAERHFYFVNENSCDVVVTFWSNEGEVLAGPFNVASNRLETIKFEETLDLELLRRGFIEIERSNWAPGPDFHSSSIINFKEPSTKIVFSARGHLTIEIPECSGEYCLLKLEQIVQKVAKDPHQFAAEDEFLKLLADFLSIAVISPQKKQSLTQDGARYSRAKDALKPYNGAGKTKLYRLLSTLTETLQSPDLDALVELRDLLRLAQ